MVTTMDETVKNMTEHLKEGAMRIGILFIFFTDNGGQSLKDGNNWPLRCSKQTGRENYSCRVCPWKNAQREYT